MNKLLPIIVAIIVVGLILVFAPVHIYRQSNSAGENSYVNIRYGIEFQYPKNYILTEKEVGDAHRDHFSIVLFEDTKTARDSISGKIKDTEAPPSITIDIFQNNLDKESIFRFVTGSNDSNFKLGDGTYATTTIADVSALHYFWDGLYRGESYVLAHKNNIIMLSGTYLNAEDTIHTDFKKIIHSFALR
jgi:hypothetical protein